MILISIVFIVFLMHCLSVLILNFYDTFSAYSHSLGHLLQFYPRQLAISLHGRAKYYYLQILGKC